MAGLGAAKAGMGSQEPEWLLELATSENDAPRRLVKQGYAVLTSDYRHASFIDGEVDDTIAAYDTLRRIQRLLTTRWHCAEPLMALSVRSTRACGYNRHV